MKWDFAFLHNDENRSWNGRRLTVYDNMRQTIQISFQSIINFMTVLISVKLLPRFCHYKSKIQGYLMERKKHIQFFLSNQPERGALKDQCAPRSFSENVALRAPTKDRALRSAERKTGAQVTSSAFRGMIFICVSVQKWWNLDLKKV